MKRPVKCKRGYSLIDVTVVLLLIGAALGTTAPLSRRLVARYQMNTAAHTLVADISQTRIRAIQANAVTVLRRERGQAYSAAGRPRQLPGLIQFDAVSADSITFNGLGATADASSHRLVLISRYGQRREIHIYASGAHEVK